MTTFTPYALKEILVENSTYTSRGNLKLRLIKELGWEDRCMVPNCPHPDPEWNGKPLYLQLDHINGINNDNRLENLRIVCPNCHTQTATYCGRNKKKPQIKRHRWDSKIKEAIIAPDILSRIEEIKEPARKARQQHLDTSAEVLASRELDEILYNLYLEGHTYKALAEKVGIRYSSIRQRAMRHAARLGVELDGHRISKATAE